MLADPRSADQQVLAPAGLLGAAPVGGGRNATSAPAAIDPTDGVALISTAARPAGSLPAGAVDPAARAGVTDLQPPIAGVLRGYAEGRPDLGPLLDLLRTGLSPDPVALAGTLSSVWEQSLALATTLSDQAMAGRSWTEAGALALGLGPFGLLAPAV